MPTIKHLPSIQVHVCRIRIQEHDHSDLNQIDVGKTKQNGSSPWGTCHIRSLLMNINPVGGVPVDFSKAVDQFDSKNILLLLRLLLFRLLPRNGEDSSSECNFDQQGGKSQD